MTETLDVLCIGNAIVDILAEVDDAFLVDQDCIKSAMNLVDETRSNSLYDALPPAIERSGGSAGNTAAGLASLGSRAGYVGKVKADQLGRVFRHDMQAAGVEFTTEPADTGAATATSIILITPDKQRTMNTYLGACVGLTPDDIDEGQVARAKVTYVEGYLWDSPSMKAAVTQAITYAHAHGRDFSFTLSDSFCVGRFRSDFKQLVADQVDILFANEDEIKSLYETGDMNTALETVRAQVKVAAITRSEKGSVVLTPDETITVPAVATEVLDTTGAGDLYAAGFLHGYTAGYSLAECGAIAGLAAAEVISHIGARPNTVLRDHINRHLAFIAD